MICIVSVLFGVVFLGATYAGGFVSGILMPFGLSQLGYEPFYGIYFMAASFGVYVMRKPGTGLISETIAAVLECLMGNYFGPIVILSGIVQGLGFELVIAAFHYKKFDRKIMIVSSIVCSVLTMVYNLFVSGYSVIRPSVILLMLAVRIVSAIIFTAVLTSMLADRLAKSGVLRGYPVSDKFADDAMEE